MSPPSGDHGHNYRPTSLDFINRPNPVEPHAGVEKHPLNDTPRLEKPQSKNPLHLILDENAQNSVSEHPAKRRKSNAADSKPTGLNLPKLPVVKHGVKRPRIPPTLSGLHHPPPNAGLLPSMSVDKPPQRQPKSPRPKAASVSKPKVSSAEKESVSPQKKFSDDVPKPRSDSTASEPKRKKTNKWTEAETAFLLKGVAKFGIGNWTKILNHEEYKFERRTALDLKDRFRVCCPQELMAGMKAKKSQVQSPTKSSDKRCERLSSSELQKLGIDRPFEESKRRKRTAYTEAQDEALLKGFRKFGNAWAKIRAADDALKERTAMDLRDRFRTKFPSEYAQAGLTPRPDVFPKKPDRLKSNATVDEPGSDAENNSIPPSTQKPEQAAKSTQPRSTEKENKEPTISINQLLSSSTVYPDTSKQTLLTGPLPPSTDFFDKNDVFWGAPFEDDSEETERITLDRRILDWPHDTNNLTTNKHSAGAQRNLSIDPLATLNLPRPTAVPSAGALSGVAAGTTAQLPSVAAITAGSGREDFELELPSLMGSFEGDGRMNMAGGGREFMSWEEILS